MSNLFLFIVFYCSERHKEQGAELLARHYLEEEQRKKEEQQRKEFEEKEEMRQMLLEQMERKAAEEASNNLRVKCAVKKLFTYNICISWSKHKMEFWGLHSEGFADISTSNYYAKLSQVFASGHVMHVAPHLCREGKG